MNKYTRISLTTLACIYFWYYAKTYAEWHFIDSVNLIFHEAGHTIFSFFGAFIHAAAGSGFQILLPLLISIYFFYNNQKISGSLCLLWVGQNFLNVSLYAKDAIVMQLDLLGGDSSIHDWNYLLSTLGVLHNTPYIASVFYTIGLITIFVGSILALYYSYSSKSI